jgi:RNA polymerase sigma factor (sigma-70 family)
MSPFREKNVKWDGETCNGRYKETTDGFKFDILKQSVVKTEEEMPAYFLANTQAESEALYEQYGSLLNNLSYMYSISTGIDRADLFSEALIGLARAYRDWDGKRSDNFKTYLIFRVKDALNEFARKNLSNISVPAYIKKSHANLCEIIAISKAYGVDHREVLETKKIPKEFGNNDRVIARCSKLLSNLQSAAQRAKVSYLKFLDRISIIPNDVSYEDCTASIMCNQDKMAEVSEIVERLKKCMDDDELSICNGIMEDLSFDEISKKLGKSKSWVSKKLSKLRERIIASWS